MDRQTLSHYGWIVVFVFVLFVFLAFATPFGKYVGTNIVDVGVAIVNSGDSATNQQKVDQMSDKYDEMLGDDQLTFEPGWDEGRQDEDETNIKFPAYALILESGAGDDTQPMIFVRSETEIKAGDTYNSLTYGSKVVKAAFTGFEDSSYPYSPGSANPTPWKSSIGTVTSIRAEQTIRPVSMAGWFVGSYKVSYLDVSKIDTSRTTDLTCAFYMCGYNSSVTTFTVVGFEKWDTSKVTQMVGTFCGAGYYSTYFTLDGLKEWDVSNVQSFEAFLASSGYCSKSWMMDLSGWTPTSATSFNQMFAHAGQSVKERFILTGLETWDVSSVTNFNKTFYSMGKPVKYTLDVSMWNVGTVSNKSQIITSAGGTILLPSKLK